MRSIEQLAEDFISYSSGMAYLSEPEELEPYTAEEQNQFWDLVYAGLGICDHCGWYYQNDELFPNENEEMLCWECEREGELP